VRRVPELSWRDQLGLRVLGRGRVEWEHPYQDYKCIYLLDPDGVTLELTERPPPQESRAECLI
jgi:hypothetical protein